MTDRQIRHIGEVFGEDTDKRKPTNMLDRKTSFNVFKNKQAPKPPQGQQALPRIGNYQPKILLEPQHSDYNRETPIERSISPERPTETVPVQVHSKPMIIGDKDELIRIAETDDVEDHADPVAPPRRKRKAPDAPESGIRNFGRSMSLRSDEEQFDIEEQGGDIDFGEGIDNPAFNSRGRSESSSSYRTHNHDVSNERPTRPQSEHISYPYIPPPDYEDEEVTIDFEDEAEDFLDVNRNNKLKNGGVFRELEGEDFGKYLEDDYEFDTTRLGPPRPPMGKSRSLPRPGKPPKFSKQPDNKKATKTKKKQDKREANMKRNTIRDFTFSDSKIGWGDRTVKSTSAKGRYLKREKDRKRIDTTEQVQQSAGPGSYEDFLRAKSGMPLESPNSSDSGVEMADDSRIMEDMYLNNQPKQMRNGKYDNKPSVWQRLTWRFKKSVTVTRQPEPEPEPEVYDYKF